MICVICGKYVDRHNLKDAQACLKLCSERENESKGLSKRS